jgi:hypothetical protein
MPCSGCGGRNSLGARGGAVVQSSRLIADEHGLLPLAQFTPCSDPYHGQFTGASVFVVARGTDKERLFRKLQADDATRYAMTQGTPGEALTIDHLHSTSLCHEAMVELLGA